MARRCSRSPSGRRTAEALAHFLGRYYGERKTVPAAVYVSVPVEEPEALAEFLKGIAGRQVMLRMPQRGKHTALMAMAQENAREEAVKAARGSGAALALEGLKQDLGLAKAPLRIEGFDIAHLEGEDTTASLVRFTDGRPDRKLYRAFTIRTLDGKVDDFAAIREAVARRYTRVVNEELERPDLILIDGGKGQLSSAVSILASLGLADVPVIGLAKKKEEIFLPDRPDPVILAEDSPGLRVLEAVRDEAHRFAGTLLRKKRAKRVALTLLEGVPGIGERRSRKIMEAFGSVEAIMGATPEEIQKRSGLPRITAAALLARLAEKYGGPPSRSAS